MAASSLGVLTTYTQAPLVAETTVETHLNHADQILTESSLKLIARQLVALSSLDITLSVQEPLWNLELQWVLNDCHESINFFVGQLTSALVQVNIGLLACQVSKAATNTLDGGQGVHDLLSTIYVCVKNTKDVLEAGVLQHNRLS